MLTRRGSTLVLGLVGSEACCRFNSSLVYLYVLSAPGWGGYDGAVILT